MEWRSSPQSKSKPQVLEPIAEQYAEMERSQDNFYWSQMLKHLPEQIRGSGSKQETARISDRHLRGKRSLEIQHYLNAMRDWIGRARNAYRKPSIPVVRLNRLELSP